MATFFDNFNRADSATLGNNWVNIVGTFAITANQAYASTVGLNYAAVNTSTAIFNANQSSQITFYSPNAFDRVGPAVRVTANGAYVIRADGQNDSVERILRINGSTVTTIGTVNIVPANGDILKLTVTGNTLKAYINNTLVDTVNIQDANTANVFSTGQPGLFYSWGDTRKTRLDNFYAADASQIFSIDTDNEIFPGQTNVVISGENLGDATKANLVFGSKSIDVLGFISNVSAPTFNVPNIASIKTAGFKFGDVNLVLANSSNVIIANTTITLSLPSGYGIHDVTDLTYSSDPNNIYSGQVPAIEVGDQILYDNSPNVFIDYVGYPEFSNGTTSFTYSIYDTTYGTWSIDSTVSIQKEINAVSRSFRVVKSDDGKRYSKFPTGGSYIAANSYNFNQYSDGTSLSNYSPFDAAGRTKANTTTKYGATGASALMSIRTGDLGGFGNWGGIINLPRNYTKNEEIWVRWRQYWPSSFQFTASPWMKFLRIRTNLNGSADGNIDLYIDKADGSGVTYRTIKEIQDVWATISNGAIPRDQWITYELYVYLDNVSTDLGGNGRLRFWIDGTLVQDRTDITTLSNPTSVAASVWWFTYWNNENPPNNDTYVDDIIIATSDSPPYRYDSGNRVFIGT